jgi:hypothetical protein
LFIVSPANGSALLEGESITFNGYATDEAE